MELHDPDGIAPAESPVGEGTSSGQPHRTCRQAEAFAMPLVKMLLRREYIGAVRRRSHLAIADPDQPVGARHDGSAEYAGDHPRAEVDTQYRLAGAERHRQPVELDTDALVLAIDVGAHRPTEAGHTGMRVEGLWQGIANIRAANIEVEAALFQQSADSMGLRGRLVDDQQESGT